MKKARLLLTLFVLVAVSLTLMAFTTNNGNLDLEKVCSSQGLSLVLEGNNAYSWMCTDGAGYKVGMDLDGACHSQFGLMFEARYRDYYNPYSWMCMPKNSVGFDF